jgi:hypothetical protein
MHGVTAGIRVCMQAEGWPSEKVPVKLPMERSQPTTSMHHATCSPSLNNDWHAAHGRCNVLMRPMHNACMLLPCMGLHGTMATAAEPKTEQLVHMASSLPCMRAHRTPPVKAGSYMANAAKTTTLFNPDDDSFQKFVQVGREIALIP